MASKKTAQEIRDELRMIQIKAGPLRELREKTNAQIEVLKTTAREQTRQINAIEAPVQELHMDLVRAEKLEGREVHTLVRD